MLERILMDYTRSGRKRPDSLSVEQIDWLIVQAKYWHWPNVPEKYAAQMQSNGEDTAISD